MRITVKGRHFILKFEHQIRDTSEFGVPATICELYALAKADDQRDDYVASWFGRAYLNPEDKNFVKAVGRKFSLARALDAFSEDEAGRGVPESAIRELRTEFWGQYFKQSPIKGSRHGRAEAPAPVLVP